jgi:hypothetical protein
MAFVPIPNGARADIIFLFQGTVPVVNRVHYVKPDYVLDDMITLAQDIVSVWDDVRNQFTDDLALVQVRVTDMRTDMAPVIPYSIGLPMAGTKIEDPLPLSDCIVVTYRTTGRGRSKRGRIYVSGFTEDQWSGSQFNPSAQNAALAYAQGLRTEPALHGWGLVIASFWRGGQQRQTAMVTSVSTEVLRSAKPGSQRRRDARP